MVAGISTNAWSMNKVEKMAGAMGRPAETEAAHIFRVEAATKRRQADLARRVGPGLSLEQDRKTMLREAQELEAEAAGLEAHAKTLERT